MPLSVILCGEAMAQDAAAAEEGNGDIVVTAQRRAESIQDVPISITAVSAEHMERNNVRGIEEVFAKAPNVGVVSNGSRDRKEISIRGISNQLDPYSGIRSATYAFYIDEFNVVAGTNNPEILDLERVEVLRGPQGTYFGRNSIGGAINVTTKKPTFDWNGRVDLAYSSYDTKRASAVVNVPVVDGLLAMRVSGLIETSDGNIRNINPTGGGNDTNYKSGRIVARLTPAEGLTSDTTFSYSKERNGMRAGVPTGYLTATWRSIYYGNRPGFIADPDGVGFYPENDSRVNFNRPQEVGTTFWYASNRTAYDFDFATLTSVVGYLKSDVINQGDVDGGSRDLFYENGFLTRTSLNGELRLQSNGGGPLQWSIGGNIGRDKGVTDQVSAYGSAGLQNRPEGFRVSDTQSTAVNTYEAIFGQATYEVFDNFEATLGLRYSHETVRLDYVRRSNEILTDDVHRSKSFNDFSPKLTLSYKPNRDVLIYSTVSRGYKSGGVQSAQRSLSDSYQPEKLWNYEAGLKLDLFDRKVRFDIAGFYIDWTNVQQSVRFNYLDNGVLRNVTGIENAAGAESYGLDASIDIRPLPGLFLSGQVGWMKARFTDFPNALVDGAQVNASGKPLVNAPEWTLGADAEYRHAIDGDKEAFVRAEWNYKASTYSNALAYRYEFFPFIAPSYHNVNLRAGVEIGEARVTVFVENLFDEAYYNNIYEKSFYSGVQVEPAFRKIGTSVSYKF